MLQAEINQRYMTRELNHAAAHEPLDTVAFYKHLNNTIDTYYKVLEIDEKGTHKLQAQTNMANFRLYYMYCGQFFSNQDNAPLANEAFERWLTFPNRYPMLDQQFVELSANSIDPAMTAYYAALTAYQSKQYDKMEQYKEQAFAYEKESQQVRLLYLQALQEKGDTLGWEKMARECAFDGTAGEGIVQNLLSYYFNKGDNAQTEAFAQEICEKRPTDKMGPYALGLIAMNKENYAEARSYFDKTLDIDPDYFDALFNAGVCLCNEGYAINDALTGKKMTKTENDTELEKVKAKYREAEPYFLKIQQLRPDQPNRWANRLRTIYYILGDKEKEAEMEIYCN